VVVLGFCRCVLCVGFVGGFCLCRVGVVVVLVVLVEVGFGVGVWHEFARRFINWISALHT